MNKLTTIEWARAVFGSACHKRHGGSGHSGPFEAGSALGNKCISCGSITTQAGITISSAAIISALLNERSAHAS